MLVSLCDTADSCLGCSIAREEYRAALSPYGDDDHGFCRWLLARPRLTPSA
jgi:hypothetical protein